MFKKITGSYRKMPDWLKVILLLLLAFVLLVVVPFVCILLWAWTTDVKYDRIAREIIDPMAAEYVRQTYPDRDFVLEDAGYAFKDNCFYVRIYSPSSPDTYFRLSYHYKTYELEKDSYDTWVLSGWNTRERVVENYQTMVKECLENMDGLSRLKIDFCEHSNSTSNDLYFSPQGLDPSTLIVDHPYDVAVMGGDYGYLEVTFLEDEDNINLQRLYERSMEIDDLLNRSGIGYYVMEVTLANGEYPDNTIEFYIYGMRREDLTAEDPLGHLQEMWDVQEANRQAIKAKWEKADG